MKRIGDRVEALEGGGSICGSPLLEPDRASSRLEPSLSVWAAPFSQSTALAALIFAVLPGCGAPD